MSASQVALPEHMCSWFPHARSQKPELQGLPPQAQRRTRTGDPFLTMEVLYQLS